MSHEVVVMDNMEEYTVSNDLSACGLPGNYDVTAGAKALFGRVVPLINVEVVMMPASVLEVLGSARWRHQRRTQRLLPLLATLLC